MSIVTFDTCIFIAYKPSELPKGFRMTAIVLQELTAGATDETEVKAWNAVRRARERDKTLLVPTGEDWWVAGKVLNSLQRGLKSRNRGITPRMSSKEVHRIIRDVLIARISKQANALLVTDNTKDFERIKHFCNVRVISGSKFFGY